MSLVNLGSNSQIELGIILCVAFLMFFSLRILLFCSHLYGVASCNIYAEVFFLLQKSIPHP